RCCMMNAVEVAAYLRDEAWCRELLQHVLRYDGLFISWGMPIFGCEGPVTRLLGLLYEALGDQHRADAAFASALASAERVRAVPHAVRIRYEWARAKRSRTPSPTPTEELNASFEVIAREADALGMTGLVELVARQMSPSSVTSRSDSAVPSKRV